MAKKFFYTCVGALALASAYLAGSTPVRAQAAAAQYFAGVGGASAAMVGRTLYYMSPATSWRPRVFPEQVPGTEAIASVLVYNAGYDPPATTVVLEGGDVYHFNGTMWLLVGSYSGATAVQHESWGALKVQTR